MTKTAAMAAVAATTTSRRWKRRWMAKTGWQRHNEKCRSPMPMEMMMREQNKNKEKSVLFALNKYYCNKYWQKALRFISSVSFSCLFKWGTHRPSTANCDAAADTHTHKHTRVIHRIDRSPAGQADWVDDDDGDGNNNDSHKNDNNVICGQSQAQHYYYSKSKMKTTQHKNPHKIFIVRTQYASR